MTRHSRWNTLRSAAWWAAMALAPALVSGTASAQLPPFYPATFQAVGIVDEVSMRHNYIIVDDQQYTFAENVQIRSPSGPIAKQALRKGMALGLNYRTAPNYERFVTEIWVLPTSAVPNR